MAQHAPCNTADCARKLVRFLEASVTNETHENRTPVDGIWKRFLLLIPLALVLALIAGAHVSIVGNTYDAFGFYAYTPDEIAQGTTEVADPSVVKVTNVDKDDYGNAIVSLEALSDGDTTVSFNAPSHQETWRIAVRMGLIFERGVNFDGWLVFEVCILVFIISIALLFLSGVVRLRRHAWFGYTMIAMGGGFLFFLFQSLFFGYALRYGNPRSITYFLDDLTNMVEWFAALSFYPMAILALAVSISNISLIRHEGRRPINLLGVFASVVWFVVYAWWIFFYDGFAGSFPYLAPLLPVAIAFGECLLLSTMLCGWLASRHRPSTDLSHVIILGCGIRDDGTPCPLLAGRVDRAVAHDEAQRAEGNNGVTFVPSGGQGDDEPISEAESMANYLHDHAGVERDRIVLEGKSTTTMENMRFSREVIESATGRDVTDLSIGFSTTNYHVLRGYVCAHANGMAVQGMGSKTKLYFWPNAFLREFVGLLAARWKAILQTYLIVVIFYTLCTHALQLAMH